MACAAVNSPNGGEKDTVAPVVVSTEPANASTNFDTKQIIIQFNEFIAQENFEQKLIVSPPVSDDFKVIYKGKKLKLILPDSLDPNTTYSFQFGNSIKDFTEGNELANYQYVFSTGDLLDSLSLSGYVLNAQTGQSVEKSWVLLFEKTENSDSLLLAGNAKYISQTNSKGAFRFDYLAEGEYHLFALVDQNGDLKLQPELEMAGFYSGLVTPDTSASYLIHSFVEEEPFKFNGASYSEYGRVQAKFKGNNEPFEMVLESPEIYYQTWNSTVDSSSIWFNPEAVDSMVVFVHSINSVDTVSLKKLPFSKRSFKLNALKASYSSNEKIILSSRYPFELKDSTGMLLTNSSRDTVPFRLKVADGEGFEIGFEKKEAEVYNLQINPICFQSFLSEPNDSIQYSFRINPKEEYSSVVLTLPEDYLGEERLLELVSSKGQLVKEYSIAAGDSSFVMNYINPSEYTIRLIVDANKNGKWDAGSIQSGLQPELVLRHQGVLKLKANWMVDITFQRTNSKLSESRKKGSFSR